MCSRCRSFLCAESSGPTYVHNIEWGINTDVAVIMSLCRALLMSTIFALVPFNFPVP